MHQKMLRLRRECLALGELSAVGLPNPAHAQAIVYCFPVRLAISRHSTAKSRIEDGVGDEDEQEDDAGHMDAHFAWAYWIDILLSERK